MRSLNTFLAVLLVAAVQGELHHCRVCPHVHPSLPAQALAADPVRREPANGIFVRPSSRLSLLFGTQPNESPRDALTGPGQATETQRESDLHHDCHGYRYRYHL